MVKVDSLSVVIPVYNDEEVIKELVNRLVPVVTNCSDKQEIIFVDDGSIDNSWKLISEISNKELGVRGIRLTRNFGQHSAIAAGLDASKHEFVVLMDSDLQDKPEDIPLLLNAMLEAETSMAIAKWISRKDGLLKRFLSGIFYATSSLITRIYHEPGLGVFRVIKRSVLVQIEQMRESTATVLSLLYWAGFDYVAVPLHRDNRYAGDSGYTLKKSIKLALDRILSFSNLPTRLMTIFGLFLGVGAALMAGYLIIRRLYGDVAAGWTSLAVLVLLLFGIAFVFLGLLGEYLGRIYTESRVRPRYLVRACVGEQSAEKVKYE